MRRFFVDSINENSVEASVELSSHITKVLRMDTGDAVILFDGSGAEYSAVISKTSSKNVEFNIISTIHAKPESNIKIAVYQAVIKNDNFSDVVQKCTELGVAEIHPFLSARCVKIPSEPEKFTKRNKKIAINASEQCGRVCPPIIFDIENIDDICSSMRGDLRLLAYENEFENTLKAELRSKTPTSIDLIIGPEGGFTDDEVAMLKSKYVVPVSIGKNILRAVTAAPAASAMIFYEYEQ